MSSPCASPLDLGCYESCTTVPLVNNDADVYAVQTGTHTLEFWQFGAWSEKTFTATASSQIVLPNVFNENAQAHIKIKQPDSTYLTISSKTCFLIETYINYDLNT